MSLAPSNKTLPLWGRRREGAGGGSDPTSANSPLRRLRRHLPYGGKR